MSSIETISLTQNISGMCRKHEFTLISYLYTNKLESTLPSSIGRMIKLLYLDIDSNSLRGNIPQEIGTLKAALLVDLSRNKFSGLIPTPIEGLDNLINLTLSHNQLQGSIPEKVGNMINLDVYSFGIMLMETFSRKKPTDEMFSEYWGLKDWVGDSLRSSSTDFIDQNLIRAEDRTLERVMQCISDMMELALKCTVESVKDRISMESALAKLEKIRSHSTQTS